MRPLLTSSEFEGRPFILYTANWNIFKKQYDKLIKKNYISGSEIKRIKNVSGEVLGWQTVFIEPNEQV